MRYRNFLHSYTLKIPVFDVKHCRALIKFNNMYINIYIYIYIYIFVLQLRGHMSTEKKIDINSLCYQIIEQAKGVRLTLGCCQTNFTKKKTGVAKSLIEKYERGIQNILPETLERMAKNLPNDIEDFFLESTNCVCSKDKKSLDLVQALKRIKEWKVRDAMCALTRFLLEIIQIRKVTAEVRPVKYQMVQKARDWRFARGCTDGISRYKWNVRAADRQI
jgi:transcriptional regulator with XRE-family HTH domain